MGMSTDADMSLTETVNALHEEIDLLRERLVFMTESRDKWKKMAEFFASKYERKL